MKQRTKELLWVLIVAMGFILASALYDLLHAAKVGGEWVPLGPFNGGINTTSNKGQLSPSEFVESENFMWLDSRLRGNDGTQSGGHLEVREGFYRFGAPESAQGVEWIDIFKSPLGTNYLMYSDGTDLWYRTNLTAAATALSFGRANAGTVDTYTGSKNVHGNEIDSLKWRTIFGTNEGGTITIAGTDHTIDVVVLDTLIFLESAVGSGGLAQSYNLDYAAIDVRSGFQVNNNYLIYANVGKFSFASGASFTILDSLTGTRYQYTAVARSCSPYFSNLKFTSSGLTDNFAGKFLRIVTNPKSAGTPANQLASNQYQYMSYPIWTSGGGFIQTFGTAFMPDSTTAQYFCIEDLVYDSTSKFTRTMDSVRMFAADSAATACIGEAFYLKLWCDSCFFDADTNSFISGDWFVIPHYAYTDGEDTYTGNEIPTAAEDVYPLVGGYRGADGAWYAAVHPSQISRHLWTINGNAKSFVFYRMKANKNISAVGIDWAVFHQSSVFEVRSDENDVIYWSVPNLPDSFLVDSWLIVDHGNPLIVGAPQGGNLVVYTATNRWAIVYGGGTSFAKQYLDGQRGCIARGSFLNIDGVHYGLAADGYWETAGEAPRLISGAVATYFTDSLDFGRLEDVAAGYDAENDNIWISQKDNFTLVYNRASGSWWPQSWQAGAFAYNGDITVSDSVRFIAGGTDSSTLYVRGGTTDDGDSLVAVMQTGYLDYGASQLIKNVKGLRLGYEADRPISWGCVSYGLNYSTGSTFEAGSFSGSLISGWSEQQMRFFQGTYRGKRMSHRLTFYNASGLKLPYLQALVKMGVEE